MRFWCFIGFFIFLALESVRSATEADCDTSTNVMKAFGQRKLVRICKPEVKEVNNADFTISADIGLTALEIRNEKGVKFLPSNLFHAFKELVSVQVLFCSVTTINENHFKYLRKLWILNLDNNKIDYVANDAFVDLKSLEALILSHNRIQFLGKNTFSSLEILKKLDLSYNEIQILQPRILNSLINLGTLNLAKNEIFNLDDNIFKSLTNLTRLSIRGNKLEKIQKSLLITNLKLEKLSLQGNKIKYHEKTFEHLMNVNHTALKESLAEKGTNITNRFGTGNHECGVSKLVTGLIAFGNKFSRGDFPWTVALISLKHKPNQYFCSGSVISLTFVLSAAHCIRSKQLSYTFEARDILARFGAYDLSDDTETGRYYLSPRRVIVHPDWNPLTTAYDGDISLLEFEKGQLHFNDFVQPICLWESQDDPGATEGKVVGWGQSEDKTKRSEKVAKVVTANIQTNEECFLEQNRLTAISSIRTFCAGLRNGSGVCTGDSGAGFFIEVEGIAFLKGIVSSSLLKDNFCDVNNNAVYTNVFKYKEWIRKGLSGELLGEDSDLPVFDAFYMQPSPTVYCAFESWNGLNTCIVTQEIPTDYYFICSTTSTTVEGLLIGYNRAIKHFPRTIGTHFPDLKELDASAGGLKIIRNYYFKNMRKLQNLDLSDNRIKTIESKAFEDLVNVRKLILADNLIEKLSKNLFKSMVELDNLDLENNKIKLLGSTTFQIPANLIFRWVNLKGNVCIDEFYYSSNFEKLEQDLKEKCMRF